MAVANILISRSLYDKMKKYSLQKEDFKSGE